MPFTIYFENLPTASSTTREITVVDQFDTNLDLRTFRLGEIVFSQYTVSVPANRSFFSASMPLTNQASNIVANISASVNVETGTATWTLTAIDLNTGAEPLNPNFGLLPPDTTNSVGEGYIQYTIQPLAGSPTGTVVTNQAVITFESNAPIATPITTNTLDSVAPTSRVAALPAVVLTTNVTVSWSGSDDRNGSGIQSYKIYVSENSNAFSLWYNTSTNTNNVLVTSAVFTGQSGNTYGFYSQASDYAGNVEAPHATADTSVLMSVNTPPTLTPVPDQVVDVGTDMIVSDGVTSPGQAGTRLGATVVGSPPGVQATVSGTNVVITWAPGAFQAGTTNLIQVVVTNNGVPPLSTTQTFLVVVPDYVSAAIVASLGRQGQGVCLPMSLFTSTSLTNVNFMVTVPATGLTNWSVTLLSPVLCHGTVTNISPTELLVSLTTCSNQALLVTNQNVAELCLDIGSNVPSQVVRIPISAVEAYRTNGTQVADTYGYPFGQLVIVGEQPLLDIQESGTNGLVVTLYGTPGTTNELQSSQSLSKTNGSWQTIWQNVLTNLATPISVPIGTNSHTYFRAVTPSQ
jgi:hypothetical protein